ncbi:MAG: peptidase FtsH domain protein [Gemmatimonadetes bacterium]|nr:peptidase FtsH domain protein [Gemmatimonadota bacterium]
MSDRDNGSPRSSRWGRITRQVSFWVLLILVPITLMQLTASKAPAREPLDYWKFREEVARGNVKDASFVDGTVVEGQFRAPIVVHHGTDTRSAEQYRTRLPTRDPQTLVADLEKAGVQVSGRDPDRDWGGYFVGVLPWLLIIGFWIFIFRQMQSSGNKAFQFGKSRAKLMTGDTPKVTFDDVAGCDEAKVELQEIVEFLKDPKKFSRLGGRIPKGALLVGPPGTGKTLLARAVAGEAGRPFFSMSGSDFVEMFVGVGASRVRDLFEQGKTQAPCIIFIDEIDAVGRHRGAGLGGGHDEREQTLNQLLVEMDGFEGTDGVILIAATNRADVLDPALLRPGRFDRQVVVDAPDVRGREAILRVHVRKVPLATDVNLSVIARGTPGMSGADLANLINEAALLAARRDRDMVYMADFEDAKDKVMLGAERRSFMMKEEERRNTAYHESGHVLCNIFVPGNDPVHKVTIVPRGQALGIAFTLPEDDRVSVTRQQLEARLVMAYGGRAAEELFAGAGAVTTGAAGDIQMATGIARKYVTQWGLSEAVGPILISDNTQEVFLGRDLGHRREVSEKTAELVDSEVFRIISDAQARARQVLKEHEPLLHVMAAALLERETLTREEIEILASGRELPPFRPALPVPSPSMVESPPHAAPRPSPAPGVEGLKPRLA